MKLVSIFKSVFCFLLVFASSYGQMSLPSSLLVGEEAERLENLISVTEKNLKEQKELLVKLQEFQEIKKDFLEKKGSNSKVMGGKIIQSAQSLLKQIQDNHLQQIFSADFMGELEFFSKFSK